MTGFALYDPKDSVFLYSWNENKYFAPASNTKLLTFYAGLKLLRDSIPGLKYQIRNDSLYFTGTGDPTFLHSDFSVHPAFDFLKNTSLSLNYVKSELEDEKFAPGWAWEDYEYYFQPERNSFPIYGNTVTFAYDSTRNSFDTQPAFFDPFTEIRDKYSEKLAPNRLKNTNVFNFDPDTSRSDYKNSVPFITSHELTIRLLEDTLKKSIQYVENFKFDTSKILYTQPTSKLLAIMLKRSDNFYAEQIQYLCASEMRMPLSADLVREYIEQEHLKINPRPPIWKDGSGLSRYNLMTPKSLIGVLNYIAVEIGIEQMKQMLPIGGVDGTIKHWYKALPSEEPYVFAKTGTFNNNHNLTGIIHTKSGKDLFFSFMNNNYPSSSRPIKTQMEKILRMIYEKY